MKIYARLIEELNHGPVAMATVVRTEGSSPGQPAMKMLVGENGRVAGTIGGGHVEATVEAAARETLATSRPRTLQFTLDDDLAEEGGLLCGGTVHILVERITGPADWASGAVALVRGGRRGVLIAKIGETIERELLEGDAAKEWLESDEPRLVDATFIEPLVRPRCIVLGAGHIGRAVAELAVRMGFTVVTVDDRAAQAAAVGAGETLHAPLVEGFGSLEPGRGDYVISVTRGAGLDLDCCRAALSADTRFVGMLGSRRKAEKVRQALSEEGIEAGRLHAPIGLDLGAKTSEEIALSIVAQMIKVRRTGRGDR